MQKRNLLRSLWIILIGLTFTTASVAFGDFHLNVAISGTGSGTVRSLISGIDMSGINCEADCDEDYADGTVVTLKALPDPGYYFAGWSDDCISKALSCKVKLDADKNVTANFTTSPPQQTTWSKIYAVDSENSEIWSIQQTADGGYVIGGVYGMPGYYWTGPYLAKVSPLGIVEWQESMTGAYGPIYNVEQTSDGGYIASVDNGLGQGGVRLYKLSENGEYEWGFNYGSDDLSREARIKQTSDGGYLVVGHSNSFGAGGYDIWLLKLDGSGNEVWEKGYGGTGDERAYDFEETQEGKYMVVGYTTSAGAGGHDILALMLSSTGEVDHVGVYGGAGDDRATSIKGTSDGGFIVSAFTGSFFSGPCTWVLKLNGIGGVVWHNAYHRDHLQNYPFSIEETGDGGYIVSGGAVDYSAAGLSGLMVLKLDSSGAIEWQKGYDWDPEDSDQGGGTGLSIHATADGGYIVGGRQDFYDGSHNTTWVLKLNSVGGVFGCPSGLVKNLDMLRYDVNPTLGSMSVSAPDVNSSWGFVTVEPTALSLLVGDVCTGSLDTDGDGMDDDWEYLYFGNLDKDGTTDTDTDGLTDLEEFLNSTNPTLEDTDDDCYTDYQEVTFGIAGDATDPNANPADEDDDCITDAEEMTMDTDGDGISNYEDNCENTHNPGQVDVDADDVGDVCDNCPNILNADQADADQDGVGDVCDNAPSAWNPGQEDYDSDGIPDVLDNCPQHANPKTDWTDINGNPHTNEQPDFDLDGLGDACDGDDYSTKPSKDPNPPPPDGDGDGIADSSDNCPSVANPQQTDTDGDGQGDACDVDLDGDGVDDKTKISEEEYIPISVADGGDNCPQDANPKTDWTDIDGTLHTNEQPDYDLDELGDACDPDDDNDGVLDNCDSFNNPSASDSDGDGVIDACDNCINDPNPNQEDEDNNGIGNVCESMVRIQFTLTDPDSPTTTYDDWHPADGREAQIHAKLVDLNGNPLIPGTTIALSLVGNLTSNLSGKYLNHDPNAGDYNNDPDYIVVSGEGTETITIQSRDYGGKTVISATTSYGGEPVTGELRVPKDTDDDGLPDNYELDTTLNPSGKLNPASNDSDSDNTPDNLEDEEGTGNDDPGDGLTAFEEYRGVMWIISGVPPATHQRLSTERKDLFVCGVDFTAHQVPFAIGSAFANAGVDVHWIETVNDGSPQWGGIVKTFEDENLKYVIVRSHEDAWSGGDKNSGHIRRVGKRTYDIPVLGESYFGGDTSYGQPTKLFTTSIYNYFNDKPYRDGGAIVEGEIVVVEPDGVLNPTSDPGVEDKDDDAVPDKKEDANHTGTLDGDLLETDMNTWADPAKLNPFDIDGNTFVELPQQIDEDPFNVPTEDEYDETDVFIHVITHELGHAVGMGVEGTDPNLVDNLGHCFDQTCVMYQYSINWKRQGHFCPYHQGLIRIHND